MKIIIAGCRDFNDFELLRTYCDYFIQHDPDTEIVSGGANGADSLGEMYARHEDFTLTIFKADWKANGRAAGPIRNDVMAEYADALIAFWDGKSRGTKDMIERAKKKGLKVRIINYENTKKHDRQLFSKRNYLTH